MPADEEPKKLISANPAFYRWVVLFLTTGAQSCMSNIAFGVAAVVPFLSTAFSLTKTQVGLLGGTVNLGVALTSFQMGRIVYLHGERVMLTLGLLGTSLFIMVASATTTSLLPSLSGFLPPGGASLWEQDKQECPLAALPPLFFCPSWPSFMAGGRLWWQPGSLG